jgi:hypothetical protein
MNKPPISLQTVLESVEYLSTEDQDVLIEHIQKRRIEKRQKIVKNASDTPADLAPEPSNNDKQSLDARANQRVRAFQEWVERHRSLELPNLSEEAMSRESIYGERGCPVV